MLHFLTEPRDSPQRLLTAAPIIPNKQILQHAPSSAATVPTSPIPDSAPLEQFPCTPAVQLYQPPFGTPTTTTTATPAAASANPWPASRDGVCDVQQ